MPLEAVLADLGYSGHRVAQLATGLQMHLQFYAPRAIILCVRIQMGSVLKWNPVLNTVHFLYAIA